VRLRLARPLKCGSVHPVSTPAIGSAPVVERSTSDDRNFWLRTSQHSIETLQQSPATRAARPTATYANSMARHSVDPHMGGISSDHRSSSPTSPDICAPAASVMGTRPQTMSKSCSAVPWIRSDAARGSPLAILSPRSERSSHHRSLRTLHSKLIVGPAGASCATRAAATKTSRNSAIPSAAMWGATEKSCPCAASVFQRWTTASSAMRRARQPTRRPGANHDQHSSSAGTLDSCGS
jgi:hypothetical protein